MKFSYRWLCELVPGLDDDPRKLERLITMKTAECEGIEAAGAHFANVVAARVLGVDPLPKGRNKSVRIEIGEGTQAVVVCGAPNVRPGLVSAWVRPGIALGGKLIDRRVIEGVESEGMLASAAELGINRDGATLLELEGIAAGQRIPQLDPDWIIDIDNKSLTHRPDLWGHLGMAREVAAITHRQLHDPVNPNLLPHGPSSIEVEIADTTRCPRYSALVFTDLTISPSPLWLQARLQNIGLNPINNLVDLTNYILAELPQPMHAFDADKLAGGTIFVRPANRGETLSALNGETYNLTEADLVIADASGPVALAGVIGGAATAISESTKRIVLESANFQAVSVRLTSARHKLRTDASIRFEKSLDPQNTLRGLARAIELLTVVCPGARLEGGVADVRTDVPAPPPIALPIDFVTRKLGKPVTASTVLCILRSLGFEASETTPGLLTVLVPTWRATKDISGKHDLVEEIGRMIGYDEITPAPSIIASVVPPANPMRLYLRKVRSTLAGQGFTEVYNYSFLSEADTSRFAMPLTEHIAVKNPIASELSHLRRSLLPGLFKNLLTNVRNFSEFRLFEIGAEIQAQAHAGLPDERTHAAALLYDAHGNEQDFFELKRVVNCLFPNCRLIPVAARAFEHPVRTAEIEWQGSTLGRIFELHPVLLEREDVEGRAVLFDVDLAVASEIEAKTQLSYKPIRKFPTSGFDLSMITDVKTPVARIEDELVRLAGNELATIEFVRQYEGSPLPQGQKSVTYHLEVGALDHTLTAEEVGEIRNRIIAGMQQAGFDFRA